MRVSQKFSHENFLQMFGDFHFKKVRCFNFAEYEIKTLHVAMQVGLSLHPDKSGARRVVSEGSITTSLLIVQIGVPAYSQVKFYFLDSSDFG